MPNTYTKIITTCLLLKHDLVEPDKKKTIRPDAPIWMQSILDVSEKYYDFIKYFGF
jgi:hypothetical protein